MTESKRTYTIDMKSWRNACDWILITRLKAFDSVDLVFIQVNSQMIEKEQVKHLQEKIAKTILLFECKRKKPY